MLREKIRSPDLTEKSVQVCVLREIFVAGIAREVGSKVVMQASDALALSQTIPATIEFLK